MGGRQRQAAAGPELAQLPAPGPGDVAAASLPFCPGLEASVSGSPLPLSHGEMSLEGKTVRMNPVYQVGTRCQACGVPTSLLCSHCSPGSRVYCVHFTDEGKKAQAGSGTCTSSQSATKMGLVLRLRPLSCQSHALPTPCQGPISVSLVTLELLPKEVSAPSVEAFKQLLEGQTVPGIPGCLGRMGGCGEVVVGSFQLEAHTALLILFIFGGAVWLAGS